MVVLAFAAGWTARASRMEGPEEGVARPEPGEPMAPAPAPSFEPAVVHRAAVRGCRLTGTLGDDSGGALEGLALELRPCAAALPRAAWGDGLAALTEGEVFQSSLSAASGGFTFEGAPAGGWALFVRGGPDVPRAAYTFRLTEDQRAVHKALVLPRALCLRGRVLDPEGEVCAGADLRASGLDVAFSARARSASDGRFTLGPLLGGRYRLEAWTAESATSASTVARAGDDPLELFVP
jgi:hypothetical protein